MCGLVASFNELQKVKVRSESFLGFTMRFCSLYERVVLYFPSNCRVNRLWLRKLDLQSLLAFNAMVSNYMLSVLILLVGS